MNESRRLGSASLTLPASVVVGSYHDFRLIYRAGFFGIDDSGSIKVCFRYATDMGEPQFDSPSEPNYVRVSTSGSAQLVPRYDKKDNTRPWGKTIYIKVTNGYLTEGDTIEVHFGNRSAGSPGIRMQTFCESTLEFRVLADVFACYRYEEVPAPPREDGSGIRSNEVRLTPGPPQVLRGHVPSTVTLDQPFSLRIRGEDLWGNPTRLGVDEIRFRRDERIDSLPERIDVDSADVATRIDNLRITKAGIVRIEATSGDGETIGINPISVADSDGVSRYWADLHGQSEETIGTNSVDDYFAFARDRAWLDVASHQGNDFQITGEFWTKLQETTAQFYDRGRFVTFPGYEWSANTGLGGDHNVFFLDEGETIHRSCHALVEDLGDVETDCNRIDELFATLRGRDAMVFAHVGGRYAALPIHDPALQRSVEVHSAWGSFEWLLNDAFELGHRVGVVCNSDGHKGRPGASHPGASVFGSFGGLTCLFADALDRASIWEAYKRRHHYGTTGARMLVRVAATLDGAFRRLEATGSNIEDYGSDGITMGDIVSTDLTTAELEIEISGTAPIESLEIRNGAETIETIRPFAEEEPGRRIRIVWEGAEFRGRGRQVDWDGRIEIDSNRIESYVPINFHNPDRRIESANPHSLDWRSFTTGGIAGVIITLADERAGTLSFVSKQVEFSVDLASVEATPQTFLAGGIGKRVSVSRLPDKNRHLDMSIKREVRLRPRLDNPYYVRVVQEDGHMAWTSPIYFVPTTPASSNSA